MAATSGTRRGNGPGSGPGSGPGWGGPTRGGQSNSKAGKPGPGRPDGVKNGEGKKTVAELMIEAGARETAADKWLAILNDPAHPRHAEMVAKAAERMDGAPVQTQHVSGANGGPTEIIWRVVDPATD